jgi:hypothetical protein
MKLSDYAKNLPSGVIIVDDEMINSRYAIISKQHRLKPPPLLMFKDALFFDAARIFICCVR